MTSFGPGGTAEQLAEKAAFEQRPHPQRLKPNSKQCAYRSGEPLRHPKSTARPTFFRKL
jgi:hypothetical protein